MERDGEDEEWREAEEGRRKERGRRGSRWSRYTGTFAPVITLRLRCSASFLEPIRNCTSNSGRNACESILIGAIDDCKRHLRVDLRLPLGSFLSRSLDHAKETSDDYTVHRKTRITRLNPFHVRNDRSGKTGFSILSRINQKFNDPRV